MQAALLVDENSFAGSDVTHELERQTVESDALRGQHPLRSARSIALPEHQRADSVGIAEPENSVADDHRDNRIAAATPAIDRIQRSKNVGGSDARRADPLQLGGEDIQQNFRIGSCIQMPSIFA